VWSIPQAGLLRTERGELWLEPLRGHRGGPGSERPHIVFKRSAPHGTKKRKRKRKKRHEKTCGTRGEWAQIGVRGEERGRPDTRVINEVFSTSGII
jgi:hypothetical protein